MRQKKLARIVFICAIAAVILALAFVFVPQIIEKRSSGNDTTSSKTVEEMLGLDGEAATVSYRGKEYLFNSDVENYLFFGVDSDSASDLEQNKFHCDVLLLIVLDRAQERVTILQLDRDSMVDMDEIDGEGNFVQRRTLQLSFAYYFGDGGKKSCENTVKTVSDLLYGVDIDGYIELRMDAIAPLNDLVGGVTVTIEDDFSDSDPTLVEGETVTLMGEHAFNYVHSRKEVGDGANTSRMRRHRTYFSAFVDQVKALTAENAGFAAELYQAAVPYMQTNVGSGTAVNLLEDALEYENAGIVTLDGKSSLDEENNLIEFYIDDTSLREMVLDLFYSEAEA